MDSAVMILLAAVPKGRVFGLDAQTLIGIGIQFFNVSFLAAVLSFILYKPVRNFLRDRSGRIEARISHAEEHMAKAKTLIAQYEKSLEDIELERAEILAAANKLALQKREEIILEAKKEAVAIKERASVDIKNEQEQIQNALKLHIIEVSSAMAEKFVTHVIDKETQDRLFAETLEKLEEVTWPN